MFNILIGSRTSTNTSDSTCPALFSTTSFQFPSSSFVIVLSNAILALSLLSTTSSPFLNQEKIIGSDPVTSAKIFPFIPAVN